MPMTNRFLSLVQRARRLDPARAIVLSLSWVVMASLVVGCGDKKKEKTATQTAAKVNKEEITVHQINFLLAQQRGLPPEQAASAGRQALERLIDQELALQKAAEQKVDRDPRVVQQIEAAKRDIVARAYLEKIGEGAPKPTSAEVNAYYEAHPALFKERRIYSFQEVSVEAKPDQVETLKKALSDAKSLAEFVNYLKANNFRYTGNEAVRGAEQLPLASIDQFAKMKDGQAIFNTRPAGVQIVNLAASRSQPLTLVQATPAIEQFLLNERKRKLVADDLSALRGAAKIEYLGDFAADAARSPYQAPSAPELTPMTTMPATLPASAVVAAPQVEVAPTGSAAGSMPSSATLEKGLQGLK
jgi:EpsD family peptidyl-prolyl cis-trans isomerase